MDISAFLYPQNICPSTLGVAIAIKEFTYISFGYFIKVKKVALIYASCQFTYRVMSFILNDLFILFYYL